MSVREARQTQFYRITRVLSTLRPRKLSHKIMTSDATRRHTPSHSSSVLSVSVPVVSLNAADKIRFVSFNDANVDGKLREEKCVSLVLLIGRQNRSQPLNQTSTRERRKSCPSRALDKFFIFQID